MIRSPAKPARWRQRELAAGGDVDDSPSSWKTRRTAVHGKALEAKTTSPSPIAARELAGAAAQVVLGDGVDGRAELARELDRVAAADEQAAVVDLEASG